jgi:hypothetical protein
VFGWLSLDAAGGADASEVIGTPSDEVVVVPVSARSAFEADMAAGAFVLYH